MGLNLPLTRRRDPDYEAWIIFYGDLHSAWSACDLVCACWFNSSQTRLPYSVLLYPSV